MRAGRARRPPIGRKNCAAASWTPYVTGLGVGAKELEERLLDEAGVACLSGTSFGRHGEGFLRLSYANSVENLQKALAAIGDHVGRL